MGLGLRRQIRELRALVSPSNRYIDIACQFEVYKRISGASDAGPYCASTGRRSPVYGGRYDTWGCRLVGPAAPDKILVLPCSEKQYELVTTDSPRIEGNGGRGSGKSEGGVLRLLRFICERPGEGRDPTRGQVVSPQYDLTKVIWSKVLAQIPAWWLLPGRAGIRRSERTLGFANRVEVRFRSGDNPDSLRSWGGAFTFVDEEQDVSTEAIDIIWPSLRCSAHPCLWTVGTPKAGEYRDRHDKLLETDPQARHLEFDSFTNCFVSLNWIERAKRQMTPAMYRQEILAQWEDLDDEYVCRRWFDTKKHHIRMPPPANWRDCTVRLTKGKRYIAGVDYNLGPPNVAWIYRVFDGSPRKWVLIDIVKAGGESSNLGQEMIKKGYTGQNTLVVDDASGEYNKYGGKRSANSSARLMRALGFTCVHPKKNPLIKDRVNAFLVKLAPVSGDASWFYDKRLEEQVREVMTNLKWKGNELDKEAGVDHDFDAGTYPIHRFEPPARLQIPTVSSVAA